ncbi:mechanosensitive ion channel family protein [Sphingomonas sp. S1-29]|uniref:mechanosensitive ion channel family protein n=1 Tax=Sphingomonas sp. S1-29 TaxID=2991074 RepID=UPI00223F77BC|nr:mechanosensitive ion channel domain-containing protein [Sphingomonas sp. S1-29]UZK69960.1 mechanosensitive ion channel family protein [Sphingomonas sp. S1-29]
MPSFDIAAWDVPTPVINLAITALAVLLALIVHKIGFQLQRRFVARTASTSDDVFVEEAFRPARWLAVAIGLALVRRFLDLSDTSDALWNQLAGLIVPGILGWLAIAMVRAVGRTVELSADISVADNLRARRRRTRSAILGRIVIFLIGFITICLMLLSIPSIRNVGVTLMASAGIAGLAVGAAAQPALKNLIAGIQMAFTEPIRIDDVVIVDGEWGRVEEIRLTYVVIAIWDERRLVVPVSKFLEESFQNWTRNTSKLLGSVFLWLDPATDIPRLRAKAEEVIAANPRWDGRAQGLQVTDSKPDAIEVRILATAKDAGTTFDLRCDIREALLAFIRDEMPEALPRTRALVEPISPRPER